MSNNLNYCMIDTKSSNMCANSDNIIAKYSENIKSINDAIPCSAPSVSNNNLANVVAWNCNDRGSCNMGDGSYQKWQTNLRRS